MPKEIVYLLSELSEKAQLGAQTMPRLVQASDLRIGDVLVTAYDTRPETITDLRAVTTTARGTARRKPPVQVTIQTTDDARNLGSRTVYLGSLIRIR